MMQLSEPSAELSFDQALETVRKAVKGSTPLSVEALSAIGAMITRLSQDLLSTTSPSRPQAEPAARAHLLTTSDEPLFHSSEPRVLSSQVPRGTVRPGYADRAAMDLDQLPTPAPLQRAPPVGPRRAVVPNLPAPPPGDIATLLAEKVAKKLRIPVTLEHLMTISEPVRNALASTFNAIDEAAKQPASSRPPAAVRNLAAPLTQPEPQPRVFRSATTSLESNPETLIFRSAATNPQSARAPNAWGLVGVDAVVNEAKVEAVYVDCGAQINVMNADTAARLGLLRNCGPGISFRGVGSSSSMSLGSCIANITIGDMTVEQEFVIVQEDPTKEAYSILLGLPWLHTTNAVLDFKAMEVTMEKIPNIRHVVPLRPHGRNQWSAPSNPKQPYAVRTPTEVKSYPTMVSRPTSQAAMPITQPCLPTLRDLPGMVDFEVALSAPTSTLDPLRAFALIDTGSQINTISLELATKVGVTQEMRPSTISTISGVGNARLPVIGICTIRVHSGRAIRLHPFLVVENPSNELVLGTPWFYTMGAVLDFRRMCMVLEVHAIQPTPPSMIGTHVATAWQTIKLREHPHEEDSPPAVKLMRVDSAEAFEGPEAEALEPGARAIPRPPPLHPYRSPFEAATEIITSDSDSDGSDSDESLPGLETDPDTPSEWDDTDRDDSDSDLPSESSIASSLSPDEEKETNPSQVLQFWSTEQEEPKSPPEAPSEDEGAEPQELPASKKGERLIDVPGFPVQMRISTMMPEELIPRLQSLLSSYSDVFAFSMEDMKTPANLPTHTIKLKPGTEPIQVKRYRRPPAQDELIAQLAREQMAQGIIEPANSPWCFQPLVVEKKLDPNVDKSTLPLEDRYRPVHDYRQLNTFTEPDSYKMPVVSEVIEKAAEAVLFSRWDIKGAFFQIGLEEASRPLTAFETSDGIFQFRRMPQGLMGSPATFMRGMDITFQGLACVQKYFDDTLTCTKLPEDGSSPGEQHLLDIKETLERMRLFQLKANPSKTVFFLPRVTFTGFILENGTYQPDPAKTSSVDSLDPSRSHKALQQFLGFVNYYGRHIPGIASITKPLRDRLRKDCSDPWSEKHDAAVCTLKTAVKNTVLLHSPRWDEPFILAVDYSKDALAAALSQVVDGNERPVSFASRSTTSHESRLSATEGELAALVYGIQYYHFYLWGRPFTVHTDHQALTYLHQMKDKVSKIARMAVLLSEYSFTVAYKKGRWNANVDALSRSQPEHDCLEVAEFRDPNDFQPVTISLVRMDPPREQPGPSTPASMGPAFFEDVINLLSLYGVEDCLEDSLGPECSLSSVILALHDRHPDTVSIIRHLLDPEYIPSVLADTSTPSEAETLAMMPSIYQPRAPLDPHPPTSASRAPSSFEAYQFGVKRINRQGASAPPAPPSQSQPPDEMGMELTPPPELPEAPAPSTVRPSKRRQAPEQSDQPSPMSTTVLRPSPLPLTDGYDPTGTSIPSSPAHKRVRFGPESALQASAPSTRSLHLLPSQPHLQLAPLFRSHVPAPGIGPFPSAGTPTSHLPLHPLPGREIQPFKQPEHPDMDLTPPGSPLRGGGATQELPQTPRKPGPYATAPVDPAATCCVCMTMEDEELLLVCDGCNSCIHTYCADAALDKIPEGEFFCTTCRPEQYEPEDLQMESNYGPRRDIWEDPETLNFLRDSNSPCTTRGVARAARFQLLTSETGEEKLFTRDGRLVPKPSERIPLLQTTHQILGHRGFRSLTETLRYTHFWPGMRVDAQRAVETCIPCQGRSLKPIADPTMHPIQPSNIFSKWTIDLMGPLPAAQGTGNRYVAVAVDSYTKTVVAEALPDKSANSVAQWFGRSILYMYGCPYEVQCDRGGEWAKEFRRLCNSHRIKITQGAAYHPQSQGLVERANQTLMRSLTAYMKTHGHGSWEKYLPQCIFSMRAAPSATTLCSPFYLLHGAHPRIPIPVGTPPQAAPGPHERAYDDADPEDDIRLADLHSRAVGLNIAHAQVQKNVSKAQARQTETYAARRKTARPIPPVNSTVYVRNTAARKKVDEKFLGPYKLLAILPNGRVILGNGVQQWEEDVDVLLEHCKLP